MTVSMGAVRSAAGASNYFASDNYYTVEQAEMASEWGGEGASSLGLEGPIDQAQFEAILEGKLPDGMQIGDLKTRAHGSDFTFSMPKSATLLAYISGDKRLLAANMSAVKETMTWAEKNLAEARIKVAGKDAAVRTGNLVYALFPHDTSRSLDPQAHIHAVAANLTRLPEHYRNAEKSDSDGKPVADDGWRAWHNGAMWKANTVLAAIYHASLREKIEQLGYATRLEGKHGTFEVEGVNREALEGFSKRRVEIKAKAEELGIRSRAGLLAVTLRTRDPKLNAGDRMELHGSWRSEAETYNYTGDTAYAEALQRSRGREGFVWKGKAAVIEAFGVARIRLDAFLRPDDPLIDRRNGARDPAAIAAQYAVASAIRILSEREAAFSHHDVLKVALNLGLKGVTVEGSERRMGELVKQDALIPGESRRHDDVIELFTTPDAIAQEQNILAAMEAGRGRARPLMTADVAASRIAEYAGDKILNPEQLAAAVAIVSSKDRIVLVQGRAGSGKSTMLQPIARAEAIDAASRLVAAEGCRTIVLSGDKPSVARVLAFQNKMVADFARDTGLNAGTVHAFIASNVTFLGQSASSPTFAARKAELAGSYLILDEASMISNNQMDKLTAIANVMEVGRLAIVGDRKQLTAIDAGKSFSLMQAAVLDRQELGGVHAVRSNLRQQTGHLRLVAELADKGQPAAALDVLGEQVVKAKNPTREAAARWIALSPDERAHTALYSSGRVGRADLNRFIQTALRAEGTLVGEARALTVRERVNLTHEELRYARSWQGAEFLAVRDRNTMLGLARGEYRIERVFANGKVGLTDDKGRKHRIDPARLDPRSGNTGFELSQGKQIQIHEGERIHWTANDKARALFNAGIARILHVDGDKVTMRIANGDERILLTGDPMLKNIDLAYALNMHMAQGETVDKAIGVMCSTERNLANQRLFNVMVTRVRDNIVIVTDDRDKLARQLEANRGDKSSALEAIGQLKVEAVLSRRAGSGRAFLPSDERDLVPDAVRHQMASKLDTFKMDGAVRSMPNGSGALSPAVAWLREEGFADSSKGARVVADTVPIKGQPELDRSKGLEL
jgi:conjugative relaxase-like TrwC/TraI family protein